MEASDENSGVWSHRDVCVVWGPTAQRRPGRMVPQWLWRGGIPWEPQHRHGNKKLWPIWGNVCCPNLRPRSGAGLRPGRENWLLLRRPQMAWIGNRSVYLTPNIRQQPVIVGQP